MDDVKGIGVTPTERMLAEFCRKSFLSLWTFPNPYKDDKHELCDQLAVFGKHVFIFFDRHNLLPVSSDKDPLILWDRWKRNVIDKQINSANGAERYIRSGREIYTDGKCTTNFPIDINREEMHVHKIIVAHGAREACLNASKSNINGSLGMVYKSSDQALNYPFMVELDNSSPVHVFDSHNLPILLGELDTVTDFGSYLLEKERVIKKTSLITYCGEEDLLAHYYLNLHPETKTHYIGFEDPEFSGFALEEGDWDQFTQTKTYTNTKKASVVSYMWDEMIQRTCDNFEKGDLGGNSDLLNGRSAIYEMVKEPRFMRRSLAELVLQAVESFPSNLTESFRKITVMPSFFPETSYLFLQLKPPSAMHARPDYREMRRHLLEVACGALKNRSPELKNIIGIAIDAPKYHEGLGEDFILMPCDQWTPKQHRYYEDMNEPFGFFKSPDLKKHERTLYEFMPEEAISLQISPPQKIGRNDPCVCGSGSKYKRCCGR